MVSKGYDQHTIPGEDYPIHKGELPDEDYEYLTPAQRRRKNEENDPEHYMEGK